jgi:hypothetical protein
LQAAVNSQVCKNFIIRFTSCMTVSFFKVKNRSHLKIVSGLKTHELQTFFSRLPLLQIDRFKSSTKLRGLEPIESISQKRES